MDKPLEVHLWDTIADQVGIAYPSISPDAEPSEILKAAYKFIDYEPNEGEKIQAVVKLPALTLLIGKDEYGHQFAAWWGPAAENFGHAVFETPDE